MQTSRLFATFELIATVRYCHPEMDRMSPPGPVKIFIIKINGERRTPRSAIFSSQPYRFLTSHQARRDTHGLPSQLEG